MDLYERYIAELQKIADVKYSASLLYWDLEVNMPPQGHPPRSRQLATLSAIVHEMETSDAFGDLINKLATDVSLREEQKRNVAQTVYDWAKKKKYPVDFVHALNLAQSKGFIAWQQAKKEKVFRLFRNELTELVKLKRQEAELLGYTDHPYDALIDDYERGETVKHLDPLFAGLKKELTGFAQEISRRPAPEDAFLYQEFERKKQWDFGIYLLTQMGFDFNHGRQDISTHPFTTNFGSEDVRVTTHIDEHSISHMPWSCIHEGGHALYEQGLKKENYGLPAGEFLTLGIHESQSRLWENMVGRNLPYWKYNYPVLQSYFPDQLGNIPLEKFYKAINKVSPTLIRIYADELTYHFHIMIRYEIEKELMAGNLETADLPAAWNQKYMHYMHLKVPDDASGCLQDVHWSHGNFGYFPTYSLGSFYAAQFYRTAQKEIPDLEEKIAEGNLLPLLSWLREKIHVHGRLYSASEICIRVTGEELSEHAFLEYIKNKFGDQ